MVLYLKDSEKQLQKDFIDLLVNNGYEYVKIKDEKELLSNFKKQLELFNNCKINNFNQFLKELYEGDSYSKFDKLRNGLDKINFIDFSNLSSNIFQVTEEVEIIGDYKNRYDVTLLINGFPIVQIELKKSGAKLRTALKQIQRYSHQSYGRLYDFIQIFVISNKVHTRYFFNNSDFDFDFDSTYIWQDNKSLESFTNSFLVKENLMKILRDYIFKNIGSDKYLMLRPYQIDFIEKTFRYVENNRNAYTWMTHSSGKTATSLKIAQELSKEKQVVYIINDPSRFPPELIVSKKEELIKKISQKKLVICNIKSILSNKDLENIKDKEIIFIFNEYEKYNDKYNPLKLMEIFKNSFFYCFTSAPIFDENIVGDKTTKYIFENKIGSYSYKDALDDKNSLIFDVEYAYDENFKDSYSFYSKNRISEISKYISQINTIKTLDNKFKSVLVCSSNKEVLSYYFELDKYDLKVAPILKFDNNDIYNGKPIRDYLDICIDKYNHDFNTEISNEDNTVDGKKIFPKFESDILNRFKNGEIDLILIDTSMTKYSKKLKLLSDLKNELINTIYLDCNLNYERLFEVLSMANGKGPKEKTSGNIVTFRDLRENIKNTIKLFSNNDASEKIDLNTYDHYLNQYNYLLKDIKTHDNIFEQYGKLKYVYEILNSFNEFDFSQNKKDEFNALKDKYEQEKYNRETNKKRNYEFNLNSTDKFTIDSNYISALLKNNSSVEENRNSTQDIINNINNQNSKTNSNAHEYNIHNEDHSNEFNFQNENNSKEFNIHNEDNSQKLNIHNEDRSKKLNIQYENNSKELNLHNEDNSQKLNILNNNQDFSKTVNINNEFHIHITKDDFYDDLNKESNFIENDNLPEETDFKEKTIMENKNLLNKEDIAKENNIIKNNIKKMKDNATEHNIINRKIKTNKDMIIGNNNLIKADKRINDLDTVTKNKECPKCGKKYSDDFTYCMECPGEKLIKSKNLTKVCPKCGKKYISDYKFCMDCVIELVDIDQLNKICPECGRLYSENREKCNNHEIAVEIVNINQLDKECGECGSKYPNSYDFCKRCDSKKLLKTIEKIKVEYIEFSPNKYYNFYNYPNNYSSIEDLLDEKNIKKLNEFELSEMEFKEINDNILLTFQMILENLIREYSIDLNRLSPLEKVFLYSKCFVKTNYKDGGGDLGHFEFNKIYIDDRGSDALQITTIIHELSHFLLAEILEQIVSKLLNTQKTDAIEAYICYILSNYSLNRLFDEYCAHTVEGRYAKLGYQDYGSYKSALNDFLEENKIELVSIVNEIGNTFAFYIKNILSSIIDEELRQDIMKEFDKLNETPKYGELQYETTEVYDWNDFSKALKTIINIDIGDLSENSQNLDKLNLYTREFKKNNN